MNNELKNKLNASVYKTIIEIVCKKSNGNKIIFDVDNTIRKNKDEWMNEINNSIERYSIEEETSKDEKVL